MAHGPGLSSGVGPSLELGESPGCGRKSRQAGEGEIWRDCGLAVMAVQMGSERPGGSQDLTGDCGPPQAAGIQAVCSYQGWKFPSATRAEDLVLGNR